MSSYNTMYSPISGEVKSLRQSKDKAVANGLLGRGILIDPDDNKVYAPCDGEIVLIYETKHAIIIKSNAGIAILIHIGMNTGTLNGKGFKVFVHDGDKIKQGDLLLEFDKDMIINEGLQMVVPFVFPNLNENDFMAILTSGVTSANTPLININKYK